MKISSDVVVIGRNYSTSLGIIRALGFAGYYVDVVRLTKGKQRFTPPEVKSKFVRNYFTTSALVDEQCLIEALINKVAEKNCKKIIIPADDLTVHILDSNADCLSEYFIIPQLNGKNGDFKRYMDKGLQKELAIKCGLPVAKSWIVEINNKGIYTIPEDIQYPCYTKPNVSIGSPKTYIRKCDNDKELCTLLDEVAKKGVCAILIEEYLEVDKEYAVLGLSCDGKVLIVPGFIEAIKMGEGAHKGVTGVGRIIDASDRPKTIRMLKEYASQFGLTGLFDIDLIESKGVVYFAEINLRNGASGYGITATGINLPGKLIDYLLKNEWNDTIDKIKNNVIFASEKVLFENYEAGYCSWKQYKSYIKSADFSFIKCKEDMAPYRLFIMLTIIRRLQKFMKSVLGRWWKK